jgi:hypothetical protein
MRLKKILPLEVDPTPAPPFCEDHGDPEAADKMIS